MEFFLEKEELSEFGVSADRQFYKGGSEVAEVGCSMQTMSIGCQMLDKRDTFQVAYTKKLYHQSQSFTSRSTARVILEQVLGITTCGLKPKEELKIYHE